MGKGEKTTKVEKAKKPATIDVVADSDPTQGAKQAPPPRNQEHLDKGFAVLTKLAEGAESEQIRLDAATRLIDFGRF